MQGGTEARAFKRATRSILDANDDAIKSCVVSSRFPRNETNGSHIWQSVLGTFLTFRECGLSGFGLWSASGDSGAEGGEGRIANRSRSATPAEPQTEARRSCGILWIPLVTSVRFGEWNGRRRRGQGDGQPVERSKPRVGHGGFGGVASKQLDC